jgi:hypothetical protein
LNPIIVGCLANYLEAGFRLVADERRVKDLLCTDKTDTARKKEQEKDSVTHIPPPFQVTIFSFTYLRSGPKPWTSVFRFDVRKQTPRRHREH